MANKKITQLSPAATPLTGVEIVPVVQSAATVQTTVADVLGTAAGASLIVNTPAGTIGATNVQAAINEIVSDLAASSGSSLVGYLPSGTGAVVTTAQSKLRESVSVKDFGAKGDGTTDDTAAIQAAFNYANSLKRIGLDTFILHSGCTVVFPGGTYNVSSISTSFLVECNVESNGAGIFVPAAYAGTVFTVGLTTSGNLLSTADISLPDVYKARGSSIVVGSVGVRIVNLNASVVRFGRIDYFESAMHFGGINQGSVYCDFFLGQTTYATQIIRIVPGAAGWCNANNFFGGNFYHGGNRVTGKYHIFMDGTAPATTVVGNNFYGTSLEGPGAIYSVYAKNAYGNTFNGLYNETQSADVSVAVSGDTLTAASHGLVVGDMVLFFATVLPTGMFDVTPYYVVATPTTSTFKVAINKSGAAITFGSSGTAVFYAYQSACYFNGSSAETYNNVFNDLFSPPSVSLNFVEVGLARNNGAQNVDIRTSTVVNPSDTPIFRARNRSATAATRAVFAAYPIAVNPVTDPTLWTTGLSDQGVMFQTAGAESGRLTSNFGVLQFEPSNSGVVGEVPSGFRSASFTTLGATSVPANGRSLVTITVNNAAVNDYVVPSVVGLLPDGIAIAWARVSAASTVQFAFHNWTAAPIDIAGAQLQAIVFRRFS